MENNTEDWLQRDNLSRVVIKGIYGDYFSDDDIDLLIRQKGSEVSDKISAAKIHRREAAMMIKALLHGFTPNKVRRRTEEIFKSLVDEEKEAVRIAIGMEHGSTPTKLEVATRLKISPVVLEQLIESATQKINPGDPEGSRSVN